MIQWECQMSENKFENGTGSEGRRLWHSLGPIHVKFVPHVVCTVQYCTIQYRWGVRTVDRRRRNPIIPSKFQPGTWQRRCMSFVVTGQRHVCSLLSIWSAWKCMEETGEGPRALGTKSSMQTMIIDTFLRDFYKHPLTYFWSALNMSNHKMNYIYYKVKMYPWIYERKEKNKRVWVKINKISNKGLCH